MTVEEMKEFKNLVNKNMCQALCQGGCSISSSERLAYAATIAEYARKGMEHKDTSTEMLKALRRAFKNVEILSSHLIFSDLTEITGYRYDKESRRTYFRIKGRMAVSDINGIATDLNAVRMVLGLCPLQEEEKTA